MELGGYDIPDAMQGKSLLGRSGATATAGFSERAEEIIRERLKGLGYIS